MFQHVLSVISVEISNYRIYSCAKVVRTINLSHALQFDNFGLNMIATAKYQSFLFQLQ